VLPEAVTAAFNAIRLGRLFPLAWVATNDLDGSARVRTVRVVGFNLQQRHLVFAAHRQHEKFEQIERDPRGEVCLLDPEGPLQLRIRCVFVADESSAQPMRSRYWQKLSGQSRLQLYQAEPESEEPSVDYKLVEARFGKIDLLDLRGQVPQRTLFVPTERGYASRPLSV
jgi:pyridoxine/pyridoxamine 5'-phosphate oxidase